MVARILSALVGVFVLSLAQDTRAIDPLASRASHPAFMASTDAVSHKAAFVGLPVAKLATATESINASPMSTNSISAIREVYVWAWPLVYMSNMKQSLQLVRAPGKSGGAPVAPVNSLCMLNDVVSPDFQSVPCPNRDVLYGFGLMDLHDQPVIVQIPEFGDRFWLYQIGDHRMESIGQLGSMYGTRAGFVMIAGPTWQGTVPDQVDQVIRSNTDLAYILPRVLVGQSAQSRDAQLQEAISRITIYPLSKFNGQFKRKDWDQTRWYPAIGRTTRERNKLVNPESFFADLQRVLQEIDATPAEQPLAELARQLVDWAQEDPGYQASLQQLAVRFEQETIRPLFDFSHSGQSLPGYWHTMRNGAAFGDDYWTRTAVAKSNPFVNREEEAKYYYLEHASDGQPLEGGRAYTLHFAAGELPPADGFWSLSLYNDQHQFITNDAGRYSRGSLDDLQLGADGSLTITIQPEQPQDDAAAKNWLPSPGQGHFKLYLRLYQPRASALDTSWTPPGLSDLTKN